MILTDLFENQFLPAKVPSKKLMIVLHGKGDSLKPFKKFDQEMELEDFNYLLLNAPKKFLDGYSWYGDPPYQRDGVLRVRQKLFQLISELEKQGWCCEDIFLLGFSQGCLVSADLALNYPKRFGGLVGISGYFQFYPRWRSEIGTAARRTPWLITHGRRDDVLPIDETKYGVKKLKSVGLQIDWVESDKRHVFRDEEYPIIRDWVTKQLNSLLEPLNNQESN